MRKALAAALAAVILGGCGTAGSEGTTAPTTAPNTATTRARTTASPGTTTPIDYGKQYLKMVEVSNCALGDWYSRVVTISPSANYQDVVDAGVLDAAANVAKSDSGFYEALEAATWPSDVQTAVDDLVAELASEAAWYQRVSGTTDESSFIAAMGADSPNGSAAAVVRAKLGLPSNVTDKVSCTPVGGR